jgi:UDP-glucose 4-epimerase
MLQGITPTIYGDGSKTRDYVEVSDVVRANVNALRLGEGGIFNVSSGIRTTDYGIFTAVREALDIPSFEPRYAPKRPGEVDHIGLDVSKARARLAWQPQVELREGVKRTAEWFKKRLLEQ